MPEFNLEEAIPTMFETGWRLFEASLRIGLIVLAGYIAMRIFNSALQRLEARLILASEKTEQVPGAARKRITTLANVLRTIGIWAVWAVVLIVSLDQLGMAIAPILAGAGILGLAVGFGAQNLVRDVLSGFFLILEDQVRVGDVAVINGTGGLVEAITFRTVILRDLSAAVHVFPNGTINTLTNLTKGWSAYVIDVGVAYKEDTDRVISVMREVDEEMRSDAEFRPFMLEPIEIFGVDNFADSAVIVKARLKTRPIRQWMIGREYRRRLKKAFDAAGIEIPFPHRMLYAGSATQSFPVLLQNSGERTGVKSGSAPE